MKVPRARFTVRRLMVVVAVAAALFGLSAGLRRRHVSLGRQAQEYGKKSYDEMLRGMRINSQWFQSEAELKARDAHYRLMDYYEELKAKYERAARYPWLPVAPDPPEPE